MSYCSGLELVLGLFLDGVYDGGVSVLYYDYV